jgi:hypothetical protein
MFQGGKSYLVKWDGFPSKHNSWITQDNIDSTLADSFERALVPKG